MKKSILSIILAGALSVTLFSACSLPKSEKPDKTEETQEEAEPAEEEPAEEEQAAEPEEASSRPQAVVVNYYDYVATPESYQMLESMSCDTLHLAKECSSAFPQLDATLEKAAAEVEAEMKKEMEANNALETYKDTPEMFEDTTWTSERSLKVLRSDEKVLCARSGFYSYMGGAHGIYGTYGENYDVATGEKITSKVAFKDSDKLYELLKNKLHSEYADLESEFEQFNADEGLRSYVDGEAELQFTLDPVCVTFYFQPYDFATYAAGAQDLTFTYDELSGIIDEKYVPDKEEPFITPGGTFDLDGDGNLDSVYAYVSHEDGNDYEGIIKISVNAGKEEYKLSQYTTGDEVTLYYVNTAGGKNYVFVRGSVENDYSFMTICDIEGGKLTEKDTLWYKPWVSLWVEEEDFYEYAGYALTDPEAMPLAEHMDFMATYSGRKTYHMNDDGTLTSDDKYFMVSGNITLHTKAEVTADEVDEEGNVTKKDVGVPVGSDLILYRTNGSFSLEGDAIVDAWLNNEGGQLLRFHFTQEYPHEVNGVPEEDLFEMLYYAG